MVTETEEVPITLTEVELTRGVEIEQRIVTDLIKRHIYNLLQGHRHA